MRYKTIYVDPPWKEVGGGKIKRGADRHYPLLDTETILDMPVEEGVADDKAHVYLWVTNNFLHHGIHAIERWGFRYITCITWVKDRIGLGQYYRGATEHCLFGVRGNLPYRTRDDGKRAQGVTALHAPRTKHSRKPDEMRRMIEDVSHEPRIELFARERFDGWDVWGNEVESDIGLKLDPLKNVWVYTRNK